MPRTPRHPPGTLLAERYQVTGTLFGGIGEIVVCHDLSQAGRPLVALKTFAPNVLESPGAMEAIGKEADAWLRLGMGPGALVLELLRVEQIGHRPYLVMPYCSRGSLRQIGRLSAPAALRYLTHVLVGLHQLEVAGLVHRDLKPDNILITDDDRAVLSDLGLARLVREQEIAFLIGEANRQDKTSAAGTLPYMAPEQLLGRKDMDGRVDLWAFGVLAVELLTGKRPFDGSDPSGVARAILGEDPRGIADAREVVPAIGVILLRLLEKNRERRFRSFGELAIAWDEVIRLEGSESRGGPFRRDRRVAIDDAWLSDVWNERFFPSRFAAQLEATGRELVTLRVAALNALQQAQNYYRLDQHEKVIELLLPLLGDQRDPASPLGSLLSGTLPSGQTASCGRAADGGVELGLGREGVISAAGLTLKAYVSLLEPGEADAQTRAEAMDFARVFRENPEVDHTLTGHAAQVFAYLGDYFGAIRLLFPLVRANPENHGAWNTLFLTTYLAQGQEDARSIAELATEHLVDSPFLGQHVCAHMWGVLKEWDRSATHARAALAERPSDPECLFMLVAALCNTGRRSEAAPAFQTLSKVAPEWEKTRRLAALFA